VNTAARLGSKHIGCIGDVGVVGGGWGELDSFKKKKGKKNRRRPKENIRREIRGKVTPRYQSPWIPENKRMFLRKFELPDSSSYSHAVAGRISNWPLSAT